MAGQPIPKYQPYSGVAEAGGTTSRLPHQRERPGLPDRVHECECSALRPLPGPPDEAPDGEDAEPLVRVASDLPSAGNIQSPQGPAPSSSARYPREHRLSRCTSPRRNPDLGAGRRRWSAAPTRPPWCHPRPAPPELWNPRSRLGVQSPPRWSTRHLRQYHANAPRRISQPKGLELPQPHQGRR